MAAQTITGPRRAEELAEELNRPGRTRPTVVVTMARGATRPYIDADRLATELSGLADVYLISDAAASWAFSRGMPELTQVYGGAGRVYPTGLEWVHDLRRSRLRFAYSAAEGITTTERLLEDGLKAAASAGLLALPMGSSSRAVLPEVSGVVSGCPNPSQAMVSLTDGRYATIQVGLLCGCAFGTSFRAGYAGSGSVRRELPQAGCVRHARLARRTAGRGGGREVLLACVQSVGSASCQVALLPGISASVPRARVTDDSTEDLRDLLSVGEVVPVRVGSGGSSLSIVDVDEDAPVRSLAVLPGGPGCWYFRIRRYLRPSHRCWKRLCPSRRRPTPYPPGRG